MDTRRSSYDRLVFPAGEQRQFLFAIRDQLGAKSWSALSRKVGLHRRVLNYWANEDFNISVSEAQRLSQIAQIAVPHTARVLAWRDHATHAGKLGNEAVQKKYGTTARGFINEDYRKQRWREWWEHTGRENFHPIINRPLSFKKPRRSSALAEFVGIVLGDGGITPYQIAITLHRHDDRLYMEFVRRLITKLFIVEPSQRSDKNALADVIYISRVALVRYLVEELGLKIGNKVGQQVDIPVWIKRQKGFLRACVRGLVDTDGSVFTHRYRVNGKEYQYKKLAFTSLSQPLRLSVYEYLASEGMRPRLARDCDVRLDSINDMATYFEVVGSHNPKHLKRYAE